jgi:hypothetical protein
MALQPEVGQSLLLFWDFIPKVFLVGKCAFCSEWPAHWPHKFWLNPDETARAIWQAVRRLRWEMAAWILLTDVTGSIHARKVLLHAVNLLPLRRKWCSGFLSPLKIHPSPSVGIEPANLGSTGEHANH